MVERSSATPRLEVFRQVLAADVGLNQGEVGYIRQILEEHALKPLEPLCVQQYPVRIWHSEGPQGLVEDVAGESET